MEPTGSLPSGAFLGDWQLEGPVGRGAFAHVHRARHATTGEPAAVKVATDPQAIAHLGRDAAVPPHPRVVRVLEARLDHDPPFVALAWYGGGDLRRLLAAGPVAPADAARLVADLAEALDHAHGHGLLHLDVKPENALLDAPLAAGGRAALGDFGAARAGAGAAALAHTLRPSDDARVAGTRDYAAPEVREGGAAVDRRADVYALGALAYELLTGRPPVGLDRPSEVAPGLPPAVDEVLARALARAPERRPLSAGALARELAAALASVQLASAGDPARATRRSSRPATGGEATTAREVRGAHGRGWRVAAALALAALAGAVALRPPPAPSASRAVEGDLAARLGPLLARVGPGRPVALLPVDDLRGPAGDGAAALRSALALALEATGHGRGGATVDDPAALFTRAARDEAVRATGCEWALHAVVPPDEGGFGLDRAHLFLIDLAGWRIVAATPPRDGPAARLGRRLASRLALTDPGAGAPTGGGAVVVLPAEDATHATSSQTSAALDAELTCALVEALEAATHGRVAVRARAGLVERLRQTGGDPKLAAGASLAVEAFIDAARGALLATLRDASSGKPLWSGEEPLALEGYDPGAGADLLSARPEAVVRLVERRLEAARGERARSAATRALVRADGLIAAGRPREAAAILVEVLARDATAADLAEVGQAPRVELLLGLARARRASGDAERAADALVEAVHAAGDRDPAPAAALADLVLAEAGARFARGKQPWYADDDEAAFEAARALLARLRGLKLDPTRAAAVAALEQRVDREL